MRSESITVAIPFTGNVQQLALAVNSVLRQTLTSWRLVLIGDGPSESAAEFARNVSDGRVRYVHHEERLGLATRLNEAASLTETEYLARMDADDLMFPWRLERQMAFLQAGGYDLVGSRAVALDQAGRIVGLFREAGLPETSVGYLQSNAFTHPTVTGRTDWFVENPYRTDLMRTQDKELWLRTSAASSFAKMEEPLLFYRLPSTRRLRTYHESSATDRRIVREYGPALVGRTRTASYLARSIAKEAVMASLGWFNPYVALLDKRRVELVTGTDWSRALDEAMRA